MIFFSYISINVIISSKHCLLRNLDEFSMLQTQHVIVVKLYHWLNHRATCCLVVEIQTYWVRIAVASLCSISTGITMLYTFYSSIRLILCNISRSYRIGGGNGGDGMGAVGVVKRQKRASHLTLSPPLVDGHLQQFTSPTYKIVIIPPNKSNYNLYPAFGSVAAIFK